MKANLPVYLIGAFGGVAGALAQLFMEGEAPLLEYHLKEHNQELGLEAYQAYVDGAAKLWKETPEQLEERLHYQPLKTYFLQAWKQPNPLNNGLTKEENQILFKSQNILEITRLILKGLSNVLGNKS